MLFRSGSVALTYNTEAGSGYAVQAGVAGSVFGGDHFTLGVDTEKGGSGAVPRSTIFKFDYWFAY